MNLRHAMTKLIRLSLVVLSLLITSDASAADQRNPVTAKAEARVDLYGDPLPTGAIARIGSIRLRHAALSDLIYLPDGKTILSAGGDRILRYWDIATGKPVRTTNLQGASGPGTCVTLSPDGKTLVSQDAQSLVFWEVATGKELKKIAVGNQFVSYMYFSADGKTLAVHSGPNTVSLWDWADGKERVLNLPVQAQGFNSIDSSNHGYFSHDGKTFGTGGGFMHPLILWEVATGKEIKRFDCTPTISCFSPDDKLLAAACMKQGGGPVTLRLLEIATGKELFQKEAPQNGFFWWVEFSPDGKTIAFIDQKHVYLLNRETGEERRRFAASVRQLFFSPDGKWMMGNNGNRIRLWEVATGKEMQANPGLNSGPSAMAVSPDGRRLATATYYYGEPLTIWDTATGKKLHALDVADNTGYGFVQGLSFSPDSKTLFAGAGSGQLHFWNAATFQKIKTVQLQDPARGANAMNFQRMHLSSDGRRVASLERNWGPRGQSDLIDAWDLDTTRMVKQFPIAGNIDPIWSSDGKTAAYIGQDGIALMDMATGQTLAGISGNWLGRPAMSPDGTLLAARTAQLNPGSLVVWETASGKKVTELPAGPVHSWVLAGDNRTIVTLDENLIRIWDLASRTEKYSLELPKSFNASTSQGRQLATRSAWAVTPVLNADGRQLTTTEPDGTLLVWDLSPAFKNDRSVPTKLDAQRIAGWWNDLSDSDPAVAYAAIWSLTDAPEDAVACFRNQLKPAVDADFDKVRKLIKELDDDSFEVRETASRQLEKMGASIQPALRQALENRPSPEVRRRLEALVQTPAVNRSPELLRRLRAISVLERIASKDARQLLATLAGGVAHAPETEAAKTSLGRLAQRPEMVRTETPEDSADPKRKQ